MAIDYLGRIRSFLAALPETIDAFLVVTGDPWGSEYLPDHWALRAHLTGFTGSAGTLLLRRAAPHVLWTDSRYTLAATERCRALGLVFCEEHRALDREAVSQKISLVIDDKTHQDGHAVRCIARSGKRRLQIADGRERLEQNTVYARDKQRLCLLAIRCTTGAKLGRVAPHPFKAAGADRPEQHLRVRRARVVCGSTVDLGHGRHNQIPRKRRLRGLKRIGDKDLRARRLVQTVNRLHGLRLGEVPERRRHIRRA